MPNEPIDLWPADIGGEDLDAPVLLLRSQAALLGPKLNNLVEAKVSTETGAPWDSTKGKSVPRFLHRFDLVVPTLGNYTYRLFTISHGVEQYPTRWTLEEETGELESREELAEWLGKTLGSERTKKILRTLYAQAKG
jgi:hypothetical protein